MDEKLKKGIIVTITIIALACLFYFTKNITPDALEKLGGSIPLPVFTLLIALVDGFNPCNLFVLTMLLSLMLTESHERKRLFAVGLTFIAIVYLFYFLFMAVWLNIFSIIGFITPLRIAIALLAIIAGLINCKEYFFYRKWITLMVQPKHVGPLKKRIQKVAHLIKKGRMATLIGASALLAIFASAVELPCTAGFPVIYTSVLSGQDLATGFGHYLYLLLYNLFYVLPLLVIITLFGYTFKGRQIKPETMALIKFLGGAIMLLLGIVLLLNPGLIGI